MKKNYWLIICILTCFIITACGKNDDNTMASVYKVYYLSEDKLSIESKEYEIDNMSAADTLGRLITLLSLSADGGDLAVNSSAIEGNMAVIDMNSAYNELVSEDRALIAENIVRTLSQVEGIEYINITVNGKSVTDSSGNTVLPYKSDAFIDSDIVSMLGTNTDHVSLCMANKSKDGLIFTEEDITYNANKMPEEAIVEKLIEGPVNNKNHNGTINKDTVINSISKSGKVCYVDFSEKFFELPKGISPDLAVYSVVNTLTKLENTDSVVILVNGSNKEGFMANYQGELVMNLNVIN